MHELASTVLETPSGVGSSPSATGWCTLDSAPAKAPAGAEQAALTALLFALLIGSGGSFTEAVAMHHTRPSTPVVEWMLTEVERSDAVVTTLAPTQQVVLIRHWLSMNVSDAARALGVQRPTIYSWTSGRAVPSSAHRQRIAALFELADFWREHSAEPVGQRLHQIVLGSRSLFDMLTDGPVDVAAVRKAIRALAESGRADGHPSLASLAEARGFSPRSEAQQRRSVDQATRYRRPVG